MSHNLFFVVLTVVVAGCSYNSGMNIIASNRPYELSSKPLKINATAFSQNGITNLYMRVNRQQLLYTRETPTSPFTAEVRVKVDTVILGKIDTLETDSEQWFDLALEFPKPNSKGFFYCEFEDLNRNVSERIIVEDRPYLVWDVDKDLAIDPTNVEVGTKLMIHSPGVTGWEVYIANAPKVLPSPPFSRSKNPLDTVVARPFAVSDDEWEVVDGCQFFYNSKTDRSFVINGRRSDFPKSINVKDLLECTRYIATREEYSKIMKSEHPKLALDQFWLNCGSTPDKTRRLIEIYYDRVEEANTFFSGLQEGWRTDRGMIHIVMGVPDKIRDDRWREIWFYGEEGSPNCVIMVFDKRENRLDDNVFVLQRDGSYRNIWDRVVTSWRNGQIQGD